MESRAFFLKYRPQTISELGIGEVRENLKRIFQTDKVPQAFFFAGSKGSGKTSAARIIAKVVNCLSRKKGDIEPCNKCDACLEIGKGAAVDLVEIDAASNRGIDDIRSLKEKVRLLPAKLKYKVYIIDEVHMLTSEAFNALLKTLEEPPEHSLFVLCTTNPEKVPATIISRCLRFNFRRATKTELVENIQRVIDAEKIDTDKGVAALIARSADGSFRDGQKILEQLSTGRKKISLEEAAEFLGQSGDVQPGRLLTLLVEKNLEGSLAEVGQLAQKGVDFGFYIQQLLEELRRGLLSQIDPGLADGKIAENLDLSTEEILKLIGGLTRALSEMKISPIAQLPLEMAVIEWMRDGEEKIPAAIPPRGQEEIPKKTTARQAEETSGPDCRQVEESDWKKIMAAVKPLNHSIEALLRAARPLGLEQEVLTLEVFYKFHKDQLENEQRRRVVEGACSDVLGGKVKIKCLLGHKGKEETAKPEQVIAGKETADDDIIELANNIFNGGGH